MGIIILSQIILKNGIQVFPYKGKEIIVFYESPYFFSIDDNEEFDLGITYRKIEKIEDFENVTKNFNIMKKKEIIKSEYDIVNIVTGYYLPETLSYSSIILFVPQKELDRVLRILNKLDYENIGMVYNLDIKIIQGFFVISDTFNTYINIPPDIKSRDYISFRILMKYLDNKGIKVRYSRFGKKVPFFINAKRKEAIFEIFNKEIDIREFKVAKDRFLKEHEKVKNDYVLLNLFISVSGINRLNLFEEWEKMIKEINVEDVNEIMSRYTNGGIFFDFSNFLNDCMDKKN